MIGSIGEEFRQRYVGSRLGILWSVLYPVGLMSIYAMLYVFIFRVRPSNLDETGYTLLVIGGLLPLLTYAETISLSAFSMISNKALLLNTVFPAELMPVRSVLAGQLPMLMAIIIITLISTALGYAQFWAVAAVLVMWVVLLMFIVGLAWYISLLTLAYRDISHGLGLFNMLIVLLSPAAYTADMVPERMKLILYVNPFSYFVRSFQSVICFGELPTLLDAGVSLFLAVFVFYTGFRFFKRAKHVFVEF
ncbi:ABC transporter permease [Hoeflea sp. YIM 152468]|uniref:ABC transporter permease n=1 Tax=Hoeflea sp. YIM 152468 TaxID=3031759 RepID=UPI0023DBA90E|nr:ABC transporter permease [Hoeflea sp. YIM 152468]MDF1610270.1 ABC transporter permease [Hoeflea sp. YIM 152468]